MPESYFSEIANTPETRTMRWSATHRYRLAKHRLRPIFWISTRDSIQSPSLAVPAKSVVRLHVTAEIGGSAVVAMA